jgi:hypothetical protein
MCKEIKKKSWFPAQNLLLKEDLLDIRAHDIGFYLIYLNPEPPSNMDRFSLNLVPV